MTGADFYGVDALSVAPESEHWIKLEALMPSRN